MSTKSRRSSKKHAVDRPFDAALLRRARQLAGSYHLILHREGDDYLGRAQEMPDVMNDGKTRDECVKNTLDILTTAIAYLLENGQAPPSPAAEKSARSI